MKTLITNNAVAALALGISATDTTFTVAGGLGSIFPAPGTKQIAVVTLVTLAGLLEIVTYTTRVGDVFSGVTRAQGGTTARVFNAGDMVQGRPTSLHMEPHAIGATEQLYMDRDYYITPTGNDALNDGLSPASPVWSLQKVLDKVSRLNLGGFNVNIHIANGNYGQAATMMPAAGPGTVNIIGNPASVGLVTFNRFTVYGPTPYVLNGISLETLSPGAPRLSCLRGANVTFLNMRFNGINGTPSYPHIFATDGSSVTVTGDYLLYSGPCTAHIWLERGSRFFSYSNTVEVDGSNFTTAFLVATQLSQAIWITPHFIGDQGTGQRKILTLGSVMDSGGITLPGSVG